MTPWTRITHRKNVPVRMRDEFKQHVRAVGITAFSKRYGFKSSTVKNWAYGDVIIGLGNANKIVALSKGHITLGDIYETIDTNDGGSRTWVR